MGNNQLGGSGDPTGQNPPAPQPLHPNQSLQSTQIINMTASTSASTATPIHPVSIPTPVGIHTSAASATLVQPQQMASLIRAGLPQAQPQQSPQAQAQILSTFPPHVQAHMPRGNSTAHHISPIPKLI